MTANTFSFAIIAVKSRPLNFKWCNANFNDIGWSISQAVSEMDDVTHEILKIKQHARKKKWTLLDSLSSKHQMWWIDTEPRGKSGQSLLKGAWQDGFHLQ